MAVIAIDYDETFTVDPELWMNALSLAFDRGHRIVVVSSRCNSHVNQQEIAAAVRVCQSAIYLTSHNPKRAFLLSRGIKVDIWIDDKPESVDNCCAPEFRITDEHTAEEAREIAEMERAAKWG